MEETTPDWSIPPLSGSDEVQREYVVTALRSYGEEIEEAELDRAFDRLDARANPSREEREVLAELATSITTEILSAPIAALEDAHDLDSEFLRSLVELFDLEASGSRREETDRTRGGTGLGP